MDPMSRVPVLGPLMAWNTTLLHYHQSLERNEIVQMESVSAHNMEETNEQLI